MMPKVICCLIAALVGACAHVTASAPEQALRVLSFNIAAGNGDLENIARTIRDSGADLIALQEVDVHWAARSQFADQAAVLSQRLGMQVRFAHIYSLPGATPDRPPRQYGLALLSRFPIVDSRNHLLTRLSTQDSAPPAPMPGLLEVTVDVAGTSVRVFNTHLDYRPDPTVRRKQVSEMLALIGAAQQPTLLMGDLNAPPRAPELQPLLQRLQDAWSAAAGSGFTYPARAPVRRIDYVLTSPHFRVVSASVPATEVSDHRPVRVELLLLRTFP